MKSVSSIKQFTAIMKRKTTTTLCYNITTDLWYCKQW